MSLRARGLGLRGACSKFCSFYLMLCWTCRLTNYLTGSIILQMCSACRPRTLLRLCEASRSHGARRRSLIDNFQAAQSLSLSNTCALLSLLTHPLCARLSFINAWACDHLYSCLTPLLLRSERVGDFAGYRKVLLAPHQNRPHSFQNKPRRLRFGVKPLTPVYVCGAIVDTTDSQLHSADWHFRSCSSCS